ncbi:CoA ester lyase [Nocardia sp. CDC159]|uniref:CoA ester lyase n=1 Tax=Nocardia pulmonis TaxID=2951408 RepID=A0A9X2E0T0_9NOCA|nr:MULTISPECIES: CoA ester lyase [Nocardia]MCM6771917.1 CoA ester lyase [Nocardia pulmonis]MCM6785425.1 CoA ester lyase [Nocardia sp. CDC159]
MRSALYVPGNRPELFDKALAGPADVILLDLEDAVPMRDKSAARSEVAARLRTGAQPQRIWVRINSGELGQEDLRAVLAAGAATICLAKTESAQQVRAVDALVHAHAPRPGVVRVCPLLESAAAVLAAGEIAHAPRVRRLQLGEADLRADTGIEPGPGEPEMLAIRTHIVLVSAAAGIEPPLAPVRTDFVDLEALRASTLAMARLGFRGRACIHPTQVPIVNEVFTPTPDRLAAARALVDRFERADGGVVLDERGRMVDLAVIRAARRLLDG